MKKIYRLFLDIGQNSNYSLAENKRIRLLNIYILITLHFVVIMPIGDMITGILTLEILLSYILLLLFMILIIILNKNQKYYWGVCLWLGIVLFTIFMFSLVLLPQAYSEYYYVFISGIALTLFHKNTVPVIVTLLSLFLFFIPYYFISVYPESVVNNLDPFAVFGLFSCVFLLVNYFKKINNENEKRLNEIYEQLEKTKKNEFSDLQLKFLKSSMNPHFMFNALNSVQNLMIKGNIPETYKYLSKFSSLIRDNLKRTEKQYAVFYEEYSLIKKYLELEKLRLNEKGSYVIDKGNVSDAILIPSMIMQPFLENSMYRLFHKVDEANHLTIQFHQSDVLKCTIIDNGLSFSESELLFKDDDLEETSFISENLNNVNKHLQLLNELDEIKIEYEYVELKNEIKCVISIPYKDKL